MSSTAIQNTTESTFNGSNIDVISQPVIQRRYLFIIAVYCVIMLVSLVGNSLVLAVVYRNENKRMRTLSNYFIVNMSCSDLLISVCNIPFLITNFALGTHILVGGVMGNIVCKLTVFVFYLSIEVSLLSLAVITVDRFLLVFFPHKTLITAKCARILIGMIWLMGTIFTAPLAAQTTLYEFRNFKNCYIELSMNAFRAYFVTCLVVFVVLPLTTMVVLYSSIVVKLFRKTIPGEHSAVNQENSNKRNRKVLLMLVTIVILTIVCWLPYWSAYIDCVLSITSSSCNSFLYLQVLAFANCALNPCAYVVFNENFRLGFYRILRTVFCFSCVRYRCCKNQVSNDSLSTRDSSLALKSYRSTFSLQSM